ncbi:cation-dependent mannose-6-phosphate receptor [Aplysia californica]|uniref:Cation-dependent mannose-6-phosphate receptor n=1 Tax=Aplysia californica TaxID=6500 RepID=A0ABM0K5C2_APLCA|nr:cation-dependent mannose-6-phosphate receptor [Aplysia californica]
MMKPVGVLQQHLALIFLVASLLYVRSSGAKEVENKCAFSTYESEEETKEGLARIASLIGRVFSSQATVKNGDIYKFRVGICASVSKSQPDFAVTKQILNNGKLQPEIHNIGSLKNTHIMSGTDWAVLEYRNGDNYYHGHCNEEERRTVIMLQCDPDVDDSNAEMVYMEESKLCYYLFEMKHQALCPAETASSGLSVGSILLIVFFTIVSVYLLVGFLYSRFVLGSKGMEQIPNYEFWKDFGNLQADGCEFVCRTRERRYSTGGFGGIGDDQLDPVEEVRDENLLPM